MDLHEALAQIADIRQQMARTEVFRGYRSATAAFSGAMALITGLLQSLLVPDPARTPLVPIILWTTAAGLCLTVIGCEMFLRVRRSASPLQRQLTLLAVEQFTPAMIAGGLLTYLFADFLPVHAALLPGLWMMLFSLGIFASARLLPRQVFAVGGFYMVAGVASLLLSTHLPPFSPWPMTLVFSVGQFAIAAILYLRLERSHA